MFSCQRPDCLRKLELNERLSEWENYLSRLFEISCIQGRLLLLNCLVRIWIFHMRRLWNQFFRKTLAHFSLKKINPLLLQKVFSTVINAINFFQGRHAFFQVRFLQIMSESCVWHVICLSTAHTTSSLRFTYWSQSCDSLIRVPNVSTE